MSAGSAQPPPAEPPITGYLRGLFSGGTLAYEAMLGLQAVLSPLYSNAPIRESQKLPDPLKSQAHTIVDLGDEVFMVGRLHPMIDNDLRLRRLRQEAADPEVGLILLDVVLGEGAHPDPARELAPAIAEVKKARPLEVVALVIGTDADPQDLEKQIGASARGGRGRFPYGDGGDRLCGPADEFAPGRGRSPRRSGDLAKTPGRDQRRPGVFLHQPARAGSQRCARGLAPPGGRQ